jgi:hypothetical protein
MLLLKPIDALSSFLASYISRHKNEMTLYWQLFFLCLINKFFTYYLIDAYNGDPNSLFWPLLINMAISVTIGNIYFISGGVFFLRICHVEYAGIYMTFLNSFANLGRLWTGSFWLLLLRPFGFTTLAIIMCIYSVFFFLFAKQRILKLESTPRDEWRLEEMTR